MARTTIAAVTSGEARKASWANAVKGNDEDHETRLLAVEGGVAVDALVGVASSVDKTIVLFDGTTGKATEPATGTGYVKVTSGAMGTPAATVPLATDVSGNLPLANLPTNFAQIFKASVALTDAQIKTLPTTPFATLSAVGSGFFLVPMYAEVYLKFTGGAYGNIDPDAFVNLNYADGQLWSTYLANDPGATPALTYVDSSFGVATNWRIAFTPWIDTSAPAGWGGLASHRNVEDNQGMKLFFDNGSAGNLTGGNAANTARVDTYYAVLAV